MVDNSWSPAFAAGSSFLRESWAQTSLDAKSDFDAIRDVPREP